MFKSVVEFITQLSFKLVIFKNPRLVYSHARKICVANERDRVYNYIFLNILHIYRKFTLPIVNIILGGYCTLHIRNMAAVSLKQLIILDQKVAANFFY